jgi:hypothetical protein
LALVSGVSYYFWSFVFVWVYHVGVFMNTNIAAQIEQEMERLIFMAKRKYERMSPEEQERFKENVKNMTGKKG